MAKRENIRKWVDALRSGDYKQGAGQLSPTSDTYCCLGVACDVSPELMWDPHAPGLPGTVANWLGLISVVDVDGDLYFGNKYATTHNDTDRRTFSEIADLIEAEWLSDEPA